MSQELNIDLNQARNQQDLNEAALRTLAAGASSKRDSTAKTYRSRQEEFRSWCVQRNFADGDNVSDQKVNLFMTEKVIGRRHRIIYNRNSASVSVMGSSDSHVPPRTIGIRTVNTYLSALIALWRRQVGLRSNGNPHPRGPLVKDLLASVNASESQRKRETPDEKIKGSILDGVVKEDKRLQISNAFMATNSLVGLRNRFAWLSLHAMLLRCENLTLLQFSDITSVELPDLGSPRTRAMVILITQSKTLSDGKTNYAACLRHKDAFLCPIGSLAMYLFQLWEVDGKEKPNFADNNDWFRDHVLPARTDAKKGISYCAIHDAFKTQLKLHEVATTKITHIGRKSGAVHAELAGLDEGEIKRLGRWNADALERSYLSPLPRQGILVMSGHSKDAKYFLKRDCVEPSEQLQKLVFPWIEEKEEQIKAINNGSIPLGIHHLFETLRWFRTVILQDAVVLMAQQADLEMFNHPVFKTNMFASFKNATLAAMEINQNPEDVQINSVIPSVAERMKEQKEAFTTSFGELKMKMDELHNSYRDQMADVKEYFRRINVTISFPENINVATPSETLPVNESLGDPALDFSMYNLGDVNSARELWDQWYCSLNGRMSIRELELTYGTKWRESPSMSKRFIRRKITISAIRTLSDRLGVSVENAVDRLDRLLLEKRKPVTILGEKKTGIF